MSRNLQLVRDPKINRLLAREAIEAYRTGRRPDFKSVIEARAIAKELQIVRLMPYDFSSVDLVDQANLN